MAYPRGFRDRLVERLLAPNPVSVAELAVEVGVPECTLFRWRQEARSFPGMGKQTSGGGHGSGPRTWSWEEKLQTVTEAAQLGSEELGRFLREKGVHEAQLQQWRERIARALQPGVVPPSQAEQKRIRKLEKRLREAEALLELAKKVHELWGDKDDDTPAKSGH
jgi:transposase-like protein